jgi:hypothetical protein
MAENISLTERIQLSPDQLYRELIGLREIIETRLNAIDKATTIFQDNLTRMPTEVDKQIAHLKELHEEKFRAIQTQFSERDTRVEETARSTKIAVDAALSAAKEAVVAQNLASAAAIAKSEMATSKQIDGIQALIASNNKAQDEKIDDIKGRLDRGEGQTQGHDKSAGDSNRGYALIISIATGLVALLALAVGAVGLFIANYHKV